MEGVTVPLPYPVGTAHGPGGVRCLVIKSPGLVPMPHLRPNFSVVTRAVGSSRVPSFLQDTYFQRGVGCEVKEMHEVEAPLARFSGTGLVWGCWWAPLPLFEKRECLCVRRVESDPGVILRRPIAPCWSPFVSKARNAVISWFEAVGASK